MQSGEPCTQQQVDKPGFLAATEKRLNSLKMVAAEARLHVVLCGDFNSEVAEIDSQHLKGNRDKAGCRAQGCPYRNRWCETD